MILMGYYQSKAAAVLMLAAVLTVFSVTARAEDTSSANALWLSKYIYFILQDQFYSRTAYDDAWTSGDTRVVNGVGINPLMFKSRAFRKSWGMVSQTG